MTSTVDPEALPDGAGDGDDESPRRRGLLRRREPRRGRWWVRLAVRVAALLALVGLLYVTITFVQVWDASRSDEARPSEAIIVLGAAQYDCAPSPVLEDRLDHAFGLYDDGIAPRIVVTGGKRAGDRCTEAEASANYLHGLGVPDDDIVREVQGRNSWESLAASARILADEGWNEVVLVTSGYHALRVRAIADELGLEAVVSPVGDSSTGRDLLEETGVVAVGRIIGFRRLVRLDDVAP